MAHQIPSWLNEEFAATALQGGEDKEPKVTVVNLSASPAVALGENYASCIYSVKVEYNTGDSAKQSVSLIVKAPFTKGFVVDVLAEFDPFGKEKSVYNELLPKMEEKIKYQFGPRTFYSPMKNVLVLKDLKDDGYVICKRQQQLDFTHCQQVMRTIAKFHASSVAIQREDPKFVEGMSQEILYREDSPIGGFVKMMIVPVSQAVGGMLSTRPGCEKYAELIFSKMNGVWASALEAFKPKVNGLNVLAHGDLWINNIFFKYNDLGDIVDVKLIDFPVIRYSSPATDLAYFFWGSANEEVRENKFEELCEIYLETLNTSLKQLGSKEQLTIEELKQDLRSMKDIVLSLICQFLPVVLSDPADAIDVQEMNLEDLNKPEVMFMKVLQGKNFQSALPTVLRQYEAWLSS